MSEIKMSAGLVPPEGWEGQSVPGFSPSFWCFLAVFGVPWLAVLCLHLCMVFFLCACLQISPFYKNISHIELGPTLMTSYYLDYLCKDPVSK